MKAIGVAALAALLFACSGEPSTPAATEGATLPTEKPLEPPATPIRMSFIGSWYVHGASLEIQSEHSGLIKARSYRSCDPRNDGGECVEHYELSLALSEDETRLTAVIREISYRDDEGRMPGPAEHNATVGDSFELTFVKPYLLKETILRGMEGFRGGNQFWCNTNMTMKQLEDQGWRCGA